jgi:hypothetical protein
MVDGIVSEYMLWDSGGIYLPQVSNLMLRVRVTQIYACSSEYTQCHVISDFSNSSPTPLTRISQIHAAGSLQTTIIQNTTTTLPKWAYNRAQTSEHIAKGSLKTAN